MLPPLKVSRVAQMNGYSGPSSYVNVYPISDSSEAVGHLILSALAPDCPHMPVQKFSHFLKGLITFSPHLDFQSFTKRLKLSGEIPQKNDDETQVWSQGRSRPTQPPLLALTWGGPGGRSSFWRAVQWFRAYSCTHPARGGIDCSGNWWSSSTIRLQGSTVRWESSLPALPLIDGKIITAAY